MDVDTRIASSGVPTTADPLLNNWPDAAQVAASHRSTWDRKPVLRRIYSDIYDRIRTLLADIAGPTIELGSGPGTAKTFIPGVIGSDIAATPWLDFVADACILPLADNSAGNLIMVDVLHHLAFPRRFLSEVSRVLKPGGRLVIADVWPSLTSYPVFHFLHPEPLTLSIRPLDHATDEALFDHRNPWNSDQGMVRAIFWKQAARFGEMFPSLRIVRRSCFSCVVWPLSGGFEQKNRIPAFAESWLWRLERLLEPASRYIGFRSLVVVERGRSDDVPPRGIENP